MPTAQPTSAPTPPRPETVRARARLYAAAVRVVAREHGSALEIDMVAARLATSRRQLQRAFAEIGQTTFRSHLTDVRMAHAAELLLDPTLTVGDVARRVGYRQQAQFAKSFRLRYGRLPSDYRQAKLRAGG